MWRFPPSACVHMTHDTWKIESKCEESERKFPLVESNKKKKRKGEKEKKGEKRMERKKGKR